MNSADLVTPDGMPLVWMMRLKGHRDQERVYGPTLMLHILEAAASANIPVGFYGGSPEVLDLLVDKMKSKFPNLNLVYSHSPPFRALSDDEDNTQISDTEKSAQEQKNNTKGYIGNNLIERSDLLTMPDNFTLYLSQHQGLIINWQADEVANGEFWSQQSIQGDKSCTAITFNKGDDVRTLLVAVEDTNEYFAHFSPLDTKTLIKALAFRGNFTLCGYKFSLKGSQAVLGKNNSYGQYLD